METRAFVSLNSLVLLAALTVALLCGGCGGDTKWPIEGAGRLQYGDVELVDGSYGDDIVFRAPHSGWMAVEMNSSMLDPYVVVYRGRYPNTTEIASDDDSGFGNSALCTFYASQGTIYTARFTTYGSGPQVGEYYYVIRDATAADEELRTREPSSLKLPVEKGAKEVANKN